MPLPSGDLKTAAEAAPANPSGLEASELPAGSARRVEHQPEAERIGSLANLLLSGSSINTLNRAVISLISGQCAAPDREARDWGKMKEWFHFAISNQNYCSPTRARENAVFQDGVVKIAEQIRYLRSEMNTHLFRDPYERNVVAIRAQGADSFAELAARYVTLSPSKRVSVHDGATGSFETILDAPKRDGSMALVSLSPQRAGELARDLAAAVRGDPGFSGAFYLRVSGVLEESERVMIEEALAETGSSAHLLVEEDYNPLAVESSGMRKVSFIHNQKDPLRYQLIQDAASMGFRLTLYDTLRNYYEAGRLPEILNTELKSEDRIARGYSDEAVEASGPERLERDRDYGVLLGTLSVARKRLEEAAPAGVFEQEVRKEVLAEAEALDRSLRSVLASENTPLKEVAETFHKGYYTLRTIVQYAAKLSDLASPEPRDKLEARIAAIEGGEVLATKSGMSAARAVLTHLGDRVEHVFTGAHYWETDFLIENSFAHNPHYPELAGASVTKLSAIPYDATPEAIAGFVREIVEGNASAPGGQMICLDKSISPFFYTRSFDLETFARKLSERAGELQNPVYLVVDNTLDLQLGPKSLFPGGVPKNVHLIFTPSNAKLHQLGFDFVTGGMIEIHSHPEDASGASALRSALEAKLAAEGNLQDPYGLRLLLSTYYSREEPSTFSDYYAFMVEKRQRNTGALMQELSKGLGRHLAQSANGEWQGKIPIALKDPEKPELTHNLSLALHYDPNSRLHGYLRLSEPPGERYIAGKVFEELKRRVFKIAADEGIQLGDGTSWGFPTTRLDWYMHTLRIAVGTEHSRTLSRLGAIVSSVLKELIEHPDDFLARKEVSPLHSVIAAKRIGEILQLDRLIPHTGQTAAELYLQPKRGAWDYSFAVEEPGRLTAMLFAYPMEGAESEAIYLSKAATDPQAQGRGYFKRMLGHLKERATAEGFERIVLHTSASNKNLGVVRAYEKCGFEVSGFQARMLDNGWPLIKVRMELSLKSERAIEPFNPIPDRIYEQIHASGQLSDLRAAQTLPVEIET